MSDCLQCALVCSPSPNSLAPSALPICSAYQPLTASLPICPTHLPRPCALPNCPTHLPPVSSQLPALQCSSMLDTVTNIVSAVFMEPRHSGPIKAKDNTGLVVREQGKCVLESVCIYK